MPLALFISCLVHALPAGLGSHGGGRSQNVAASALEVRLERPQPVLAPTIAAETDGAVRQLPNRPAHPRSPREQARAATAALPSHSLRTGTALGAPTTEYFGVRQLDVYPALAQPLELPNASSDTAAATAKGRVLLLVLIDHEGRVDDVSVVEAEPAGAFEDSARRALLGARFTPALKDGRQVKSRLLVELNYGEVTAAR